MSERKPHRVTRIAFALIASSLCTVLLARATMDRALAGLKDNPPRLATPDSTVDIGGVACGESIQTSVAVQNIGGERLVLNEQWCGCDGVTPPEPIVIPCGDHGEVQVDVQAPTTPGPIDQQVRFFTNDLTRPEFTVRIIGVAVSTSDRG